MINSAFATPIIQDVSVQPSSVWLGEYSTISLNCFDDGGNDIVKVYANITGPNVTIPTMYFTKDDGNDYTLIVNKEYLDRTGNFDALLYCENSVGENNQTSTSITVSRLSGYINEINPKPAYIGDTIEISFIVKKDENRLSSNVNFNVSLNDNLVNLVVKPAYDYIRGWLLKIPTPYPADMYNLKVTAFYDRANVSDYDNIEVRNKTEFSILSIKKGGQITSQMVGKDNITVNLKFLENGNIIDMNKNVVDIKIGSTDAEIKGLYKQSDGSFNAEIVAPDISAGTYDMVAYFYHEGLTYSDSSTVNYVVSLSGNVVTGSQIKFIQNNQTKLEITLDSYGDYSGFLPPGTYDVEVVFPQSRLYFYQAVINSFDDPIKYRYSDNAAIPGIRNAGLFVYEVAFSYSSVDIEINYIERNVLNEDNLKIFKCSNWNSGKETCNSNWIEMSSEMDRIRNKARISSTSLSTFVIGEIKSLNADFNLDKNQYNIDDVIKVKGIVKDEDRTSVSNATIDVYIKNTQISSKITTDDNGIFSLDVPTPKNEGEYELILKARKQPYNSFEKSKIFELTKSKSVLIDFPDTIKIAKGGNFTQAFSLMNNGQADINNLKIYFEGIPESYYNFSENVSLKSEERKTFDLKFSIPFYAESGISSATLKIEGNNISQEKVFGLSVLEKNESKNETLPTTGLVTGITLPEINYLDIIYIVAFAIVCFSLAIVLKKRKIKESGKENNKVFLFNIKNIIKQDEKETKNQNNDYDKVILTEFPNFMKFSKGLFKSNVGDENGKDN